MKKVNWEKIGDFAMGFIGVSIGLMIAYIACKIGYAIIESIYVVLIK